MDSVENIFVSIEHGQYGYKMMQNANVRVILHDFSKFKPSQVAHQIQMDKAGFEQRPVACNLAAGNRENSIQFLLPACFSFHLVHRVICKERHINSLC